MRGENLGDEYFIKDSDNITVTKMGHIIEVQYMQKSNSKASIKKIDKNTYIDLSTGEIKEFEEYENRGDSKNSLYQTFKKMRYLINNNFVGAGNELFVTLTYAENMRDPKRLYSDFDKFVKRLRYSYRDLSSIDYISIVEPQGRGAWHCHVLLKFNDVEKIYVANKDLRELWGHGWVTVKSLGDVDNIGAYLSAYLADVEVNPDTIDLLNDTGVQLKECEGKKYIKGGRLHMYPPGINIYRCSRGIKSPDRKKMKFRDIKKIVKDCAPHYSKTYNVSIEEFENVITYYQYNLKRD